MDNINCMNARIKFYKSKAELFLQEMDECDNDGDRIEYGKAINYANNLIDREDNHLEWTKLCIKRDFNIPTKIKDECKAKDIIDTELKKMFQDLVELKGKDPSYYLRSLTYIEDKSSDQFMGVLEDIFPHYSHTVCSRRQTPETFKEYGVFKDKLKQMGGM